MRTRFQKYGINLQRNLSVTAWGNCNSFAANLFISLFLQQICSVEFLQQIFHFIVAIANVLLELCLSACASFLNWQQGTAQFAV